MLHLKIILQLFTFVILLHLGALTEIGNTTSLNSTSELIKLQTGNLWQMIFQAHRNNDEIIGLLNTYNQFY
jgi:hypothetical protein